MTLIRADALHMPLADESVDLIVTSPPYELAYMAGVMDSDGYIGVHRNTYAMRVRGDSTVPVYQARIQVKQTDNEAVDLFHLTFGGHLCKQKPSAIRGKPLWTWQVHSAACRPILEALLPFLRIKADRARNALTLVDLCRWRSLNVGRCRPEAVSLSMEACFLRAKELNHVGI